MRTSLALLALTALPLAAQQPTAPTSPSQTRAGRFLENCDDYGDRRRETFCEVRDVTLRAPERGILVDGRDNGSVRVYGWDRDDVLVRALVQATGETRGDARDLARDIAIDAEGGRIRATGPSFRRYSGWHVSFEVWVPSRTSVDAETSNGSVSIEGVEGRMDLRAVNGSISLRDVAGDVRGTTSNGSINARLSGSSWRGPGLDLTTSNGSVNLDIPRGYNAQLETGTVNGGMSIDFPITVRGSIGRRITTTLGSGGPRVRAVTTNGAVRIREL